MITKKTKRYITISSIIVGYMLVIDLLMVLLGCFAPFCFSHIVMIICNLLVIAYFASVIFNRVRRNTVESELYSKYFLYYETLRDEVKYSDLRVREKNKLLKDILNDVLDTQENDEDIDCERYIKSRFNELNYRRSLVFFLLNGIMLGVAVLIINHIRVFCIHYGMQTFDVDFPIYHTFFVFLFGLVGLPLYRYFLSKGKMIIAFVPSFIILILFFLLNFVPYWLDIHFIFLEGYIDFIGSIFDLILYPSIIVVAFILKTVLRRWQKRKNKV